MIVRPHPAGWQITLHPAHGLLAAELYTHLPPDPPPVPRLATLVAVAQHDDHQLDFSRGHYLTDAGAPKDFTLMELNDDFRSTQAMELVTEMRRKHRWAARLLGRHLHFLYDEQPVDQRLKQLLLDVDAFEARSNTDLDPAAAHLEHVYERMSFVDRLSLVLAGDEVPAMGRSLELSPLSAKPTFIRQADHAELLHITPWPFVENQITVGVEVYVLEQLQFDSSAALGDAIANTHPNWRSWTLAAATDTV